MKYKIGTNYRLPRKESVLYTVIDYHRTYNSKHQLVSSSYVVNVRTLGVNIKKFNVLESEIDNAKKVY